MEDIQSENYPLYGRFQTSILIKPMDYLDSAEFYPTFSNEDKVRLYAAFGGVPYYNRQIDSALSVEDNIIALLSGPFSHFIEDLIVNMKEEISKINNANSVFSAIANGVLHYSDILSKTHINTSATLNDVLEILLKMDLIEYVAPINEKKNKQKGYYSVSDNAIRFYYRYSYNNISAKEILDSHTFYQKFIKTDFESQFVSKAFETIVKQFLIRQNKLCKISPLLLEIGTYWYSNPKEKRMGNLTLLEELKMVIFL